MDDAFDRRFGVVSRTDIVKYAGASGDFHPLHHDEKFCRDAGYPSVFAMGMYSAGLIGTWVQDNVEVERLRRLRFRFERQVWPDDELFVSGPRTPASETFELTCHLKDGAVVTRAWVTLAQ